MSIFYMSVAFFALKKCLLVLFRVHVKRFIFHFLQFQYSKFKWKSVKFVFTSLQVIDELKSYDTITHSSMPFCCDFMPMAANRKKRMAIWWPYPVYYGGSDASAIFEVSLIKAIILCEIISDNFLDCFHNNLVCYHLLSYILLAFF